jgi:hypothetical protein
MTKGVTGGALTKVFLSHSFAKKDRDLVTHVEELLLSHGLVPVTGRRLGGGALAENVEHLIAECGALVALVTQPPVTRRRESHWVPVEFGHARMSGMRAIGVYEVGTPPIGPDAGYEHIVYDPKNPLPAFVRLSHTIGVWKRAAGRFLKVMVLPKQVAVALAARIEDVRCECRFQMRDGAETDWMSARIREEEDGVYVRLQVPEDVERVQIRVDGPAQFRTVYSDLWPGVEFKRRRVVADGASE